RSTARRPRENEATADGEPERATDLGSCLAPCEQRGERLVDLRRRGRIEVPLHHERELWEHHEIPGARERVAQPARLRVVVAIRRRPVHEKDPRMAIAPAWTPPRHARGDVREDETLLNDARLRRNDGG